MPSPYVIITPARNEEAFIEKTIKSLVAQTVLPLKWVIVSDGSTDRTTEIASRFTEKYGFIQLVEKKAHENRNFGSKVDAINAGYKLLADLDYSFFGILDADISFEPHYFEQLLKRFLQNPRLGLAGGKVFWNINGLVTTINTNYHYVTGCNQLFRRECYEEIGGYLPIRTGGVDTVAMMMVRMKGWEVKSFPELRVLHYTKAGTKDASIYLARYRGGIRDYHIGCHPLFFTARSACRILQDPLILGSLCSLFGYFRAWMFFPKRPVPDELVRFVQRDQIRRLTGIIRRTGSGRQRT